MIPDGGHGAIRPTCNVCGHVPDYGAPRSHWERHGWKFEPWQRCEDCRDDLPAPDPDACRVYAGTWIALDRTMRDYLPFDNESDAVCWATSAAADK